MLITCLWSFGVTSELHSADDENRNVPLVTGKIAADPLNHRYPFGLVLSASDSRHFVTNSPEPLIGEWRILHWNGDKLLDKFDADNLAEKRLIRRPIGKELILLAASPTKNDVFAMSWSGEIFRVSLDDARLTRLGGGGRVGEVTVSPDGREFVVTGRDGRPKVCDVETGAARVVCDEPNNDGQGGSNASSNFTFSSDGRFLVGYCRGNSILVVWDAAGGKKLVKVEEAHRAATIVHVVSAGKSGNIITVARSRRGEPYRAEMAIWRLRDGELIRRISHPDELNDPGAGVFVVEDGTFLCPYHDRIVKWDIDAGKIVGTTRLAEVDYQTRPEFITRDGQLVCGIAAGKRLVLWDATTGKMLTTPQTGHRTSIAHIASTANNQEMVTAGFDGTLCRWNVAGTELTREVIDAIRLTAFAPSPNDHSFLVGHAALQVPRATSPQAVLERRDERSLAILNRYEYAREANATKCAVSPDGQFVAACLKVIPRVGEAVVVWDKASGRNLYEFPFHEADWSSIAMDFSADGSELQVVSSRGQCLCFELKGDAKRRDFSVLAHITDVEAKRREQGQRLHVRYWSAVFGKSRKTIVMGVGRWIGVYDTASGQLKRQIEMQAQHHGSHIIGLSPNEEWLAIADVYLQELLQSDTVQLWNLANAKRVTTWKSPGERPTAIGFSNDGRSILLGMDRGSIEIRALPRADQ